MNKPETYSTRAYYTGPAALHRRAVYKGIGLTDADLDRPLIAVVNTYSEVCPGHFHLQELVRSVKAGIWQAGATPLEFSTISQCATQTLGLPGIRYDLPARELIALDIETIVETQLFDGLVIVTTCDKTIPGALLGAARLDLPTVIVPGGIMETGTVHGQEVSLADLDERVFSGKTRTWSQEEQALWENCVVPGSGACPIMGTANTMQILSEVLGISMPFSSTKTANSAAQLRLAKEAGRRIVELVQNNVRFSRIATREALENMTAAAMALGAASNSVLHMLALSHELGCEDRINLEHIARISREIPCILDVKPVGSRYLNALEAAGGVPAVLSRLTPWLHGETVGISGVPMSELCRRGAALLEASGSDVVHTTEDPVMHNGGIMVLRGNLADSAIVRAFRHSRNTFRGQAKVYDTQEAAIEAVRQKEVRPGDVLVLRFMGPQGGPGMPDCFGVASAVVGAGLEETVAVITDGRFSGFARGVGVCQICPEAAVGGGLSRVRTGDTIVIDTEQGLLQDLAEDFSTRDAAPCQKEEERGILHIYARIAGPAATGARL